MYRPIVPIMSSNTQDGFVLKGANTASGYQPYYAFNGTNVDDKDCWYSNSSSGYLQITFPESIEVCGMTITSRNSASGWFKSSINVTFSENGSTFPSSMGTEKIIPPQGANLTQNYIFSKPRICKAIKLASGVSGMCFGELNFYEYVTNILLKSNGKYYEPSAKYYNADTKSFDPLDITDSEVEETLKTGEATLDSLTTELTIEGETFMPISKFKRASIISVKEQIDVTGEVLNNSGIKSNSELVIANDNIPFYIAKETLSMTLEKTIEEKGNVYIVASTDNGNTWLTYSQGDFVDTGITIPTKPYHLFTEEEMEQVKTAKLKIIESGMTPTVFDLANFDILRERGVKLIRFAYVIYRAGVKDKAEVSQLIWNFNKIGSMKKLKSSEYDVNVFEQHIGITTTENHEMLKINSLSNNVAENLISNTYKRNRYY